MANNLWRFVLLPGFICFATVISLGAEVSEEGCSIQSKLWLLNHPVIHEELALDAAQIEKAERLDAAYVKEYQAEIRKLGLGPGKSAELLTLKGKNEQLARIRSDQKKLRPAERRLAEKYSPMIRKLLSERQYRRLKQFVWQHEKYRALLDPEIAKLLELSAEQTEQMTVIEQRDSDALAESYLELLKPGSDVEESQAKAAAVADACQTEALQLLSETQKKQFLDAKGATFDFARLVLKK